MAVAVATSHSAFHAIPLATLAAALVSLPFMFSWLFTASIALACDRHGVYAGAFVAQAAINLLLLAALAPVLGVTGAVIALLASHIAVAAGLLSWGLRRLPRPNRGWLGRARAELERSARFGILTYVPNVLQLVNLRLDVFILNAVALQATVGHYAVAVGLTEIGSVLPRALGTAVFPRVAALGPVHDAGRQERVVIKSARHAVLLSGATALALAAVSPAVPLIYGRHFQAAIGLVLLLVPGVVGLGVGNVLAANIVGKGLPEYGLYRALLVTPPTVGLYFLLIPRYGATGAAIASSVSYLAGAAVAKYFFARATGIRGIRQLLPGRDELADYRRLMVRLRAARKRRRALGSAPPPELTTEPVPPRHPL
jgi:stage V sporulation protein B